MRTLVLTTLGVLALVSLTVALAPDAQATPLAAAGLAPASSPAAAAHAAEGSSFGYRCAPRRVVVRRRYVRAPVYRTCAPRYVVRRYYRPYYRPYYYPAVRVGVGFGYGYGHRHYYGHRHRVYHRHRGGGRYVGRRR